MGRKAIRGPSTTIRSGKITRLIKPRAVVVSSKVGARGRRKVLAAGSTDFRVRGVVQSRRRPKPLQTPIRRPRPTISEGKIGTRRPRPRPSKVIRVRPPIPQISSRPKPEPEFIAFRPDAQSSREDLFSVTLGVGVGNRTNNFGIRFTGPKGTKEVIRKSSKQLNKTFSPISQGVVGVKNNLVDAFNSRSGFNNSPFFISIRSEGRKSRNSFDSFFGGLS